MEVARVRAFHRRAAGRVFRRRGAPATASRVFQGYRLLKEYFAFPQRFLFVDLSGLGRAVQRHKGNELEVVVLVGQGAPTLEKAVDERSFLLHCTPAINLFPKRAERIHVDARTHEFHVVPDRTRPLDFEVYAVSSVTGYGTGPRSERRFLPVYAAIHAGAAEAGAYFALQREPRLLSESQRWLGFRSSYIGSEVFLSLVDTAEAPSSGDLRQLSVTTLCTNRDLPMSRSLGGPGDFALEAAAPVVGVRAVKGPSRPYSPVWEGGAAWRFINHLSLNYLSLVDANEQEGAAALRERLALYAATTEGAMRRQADGVRSVRVAPIVRRLPAPGPIAFGRGLSIELEVDELAFQGASAFLFAAVMEQFFSRYVSINSFTETILRSTTRGVVKRWVPRWGGRQILRPLIRSMPSRRPHCGTRSRRGPGPSGSMQHCGRSKPHIRIGRVWARRPGRTRNRSASARIRSSSSHPLPWLL